MNIVVLQADDRQFGLVVDEINDTEEIVVKPLGKQLKSVKTFAGATIMGDGRVALILDVLGVAQIGERGGREPGTHSRERIWGNGPRSAKTNDAAVAVRRQGRMAMKLSLVARLEEFKPELIEKAGEQRVVQYRGEIMPLIRISDVLHLAKCESQGKEAGKMQVVVYSEDGRSVGLVVDRILESSKSRLYNSSLPSAKAYSAPR